MYHLILIMYHIIFNKISTLLRITSFSISNLFRVELTHSFPMHLFSNRCFRGVEKRCVGNEWVNIWMSNHDTSWVFRWVHFWSKQVANLPIVFYLPTVFKESYIEMNSFTSIVNYCLTIYWRETLNIFHTLF